MRTRRIVIGATAALFLAAGLAQAQPVRLVNAKLTTRVTAGPLDREFDTAVAAAASPAWIAWSVPANESGRDTCCSSGDGAGRERCGCRLEDMHGLNGGTPEQGDGKVLLEGGDRLVVLARAESGAVGRVAAYSAACEIDAGGLHVTVLEGVKPAESVALLAGLAARADVPKRASDGALTALALHAGSAADAAVAALAAPGHPDKLREQAIFWLGAARGAFGYQAVDRILADDASDRIRERAVFALSISKEPGAVQRLIDTAHHDASGRVRGQAMFWLAQKAGRKVADAIAGAIQNDPDTEVKKRAVFALGQMPPDEGVPRLIDVARNNRNPEVRKQAMFWLGQSHDARALAFIEEVLTR